MCQKNSKELLCLGNAWPQGVGLAAPGRLAAGPKGLPELTNRPARLTPAAPVQCCYFLLPSLPVPPGSLALWRTPWCHSGTVWLSQGVRLQDWVLSMFPVFCHLRDLDREGSSADEGEVRGQPHGLSFRGSGRTQGSCGVGRGWGEMRMSA